MMKSYMKMCDKLLVLILFDAPRLCWVKHPNKRGWPIITGLWLATAWVLGQAGYGHLSKHALRCAAAGLALAMAMEPPSSPATRPPRSMA
jgi:hypothetical protein